MPYLQVDHVSKSYPGLPVLAEASFVADEGEVLCLLGPSGCGKTTLLRIVAGLEAPDSGRVLVGGVDISTAPVHQRNFGFMFQDYALFPHMDVAANVAFGLRMQGLPPDETARRMHEMLALVALDGYEGRKVVDLSGGEQQRVALARSLATQPRLLLLDEPLGALDRALREQLMNDLRTVLKRVGVTTVYVTHDQGEAFAVADRVLIMRARPDIGEGGRIEQDGTPQEVYRYPASPSVARFLGFRNLVDAVVFGEARPADGVEEPSAGSTGRSARANVPGEGCCPLVVDTPAGRLIAGDLRERHRPGEAMTLLVRPEAADARPVGEHGQNILPGRLAECSFRGSYCQVRSEHAGGVILQCDISVTDTDIPAAGEPIALWLDPSALTLISAEP
jgi:ABC-type Fe3+/spermidine/putrescine transport system ATPase subunit